MHLLTALAAAALTAGATAETIELASGESLAVTSVTITDGTVHAEHAVLGSLSFAEADLADETLVALGMLQDEAEVPAEKSEWSTKVTAAGSLSDGNTETASLAAGITSVREREETRLTLDSSYFYGSTDGERTENRFTAGALHDWLMPDSPWLLFVDGRYDYDEFQSWEYRLSGHGGVGYELVNNDEYTMTLRAGIGAIKEFNSIDEDLNPEALLGFDGVWNISENQSLEFGSTLFPDLGDSGEYRIVSYANWAVLVDESTNMSLTAGLAHEYQSKVDPGIENNDLRIFAGLQFDF